MRVLGQPWWRPLLVLSVLGGPVWIALTWLGDLNVKCGGPSRPETVSEKIATTAVIGAWIVLLLVLRARHRRREDQVLAALAADDLPGDGVRVSVSPEQTPAMRVSTGEPADAPSSEEEASAAPARENARR